MLGPHEALSLRYLFSILERSGEYGNHLLLTMIVDLLIEANRTLEAKLMEMDLPWHLAWEDGEHWIAPLPVL